MFVPDVREDTRVSEDRTFSLLLGSINLFSTVYYVFPSRDQVDFFFATDEKTYVITIVEDYEKPPERHLIFKSKQFLAINLKRAGRRISTEIIL